MNVPRFPIVESHIRPPASGSQDEAVVSLDLDSSGVWWHKVGDEYVRTATTAESLLSLAPDAWASLSFQNPKATI